MVSVSTSDSETIFFFQMEPQVIRKCVMCRKPQLSLKYFPFPTNCKENPTGTKTDNIDKTKWYKVATATNKR